MFLFILENLGTTEVAFIGLLALIFLGPRRLPEMARKIGKLMAEFKGTANQFKETWQKEIDLEAEKKAFDLSDVIGDPVPRKPDTSVTTTAPMIRSVDPAMIKDPAPVESPAADATENGHKPAVATEPSNDKRNWL